MGKTELKRPTRKLYICSSSVVLITFLVASGIQCTEAESVLSRWLNKFLKNRNYDENYEPLVSITTNNQDQYVAPTNYYSNYDNEGGSSGSHFTSYYNPYQSSPEETYQRHPTFQSFPMFSSNGFSTNGFSVSNNEGNPSIISSLNGNNINSGNNANFDGTDNELETLQPYQRVPAPLIQIGKPPPPNYQVISGFERQFKVGVQSPSSQGEQSEGSIITRSQIYKSPLLVAPRTAPFSVGRIKPPAPIRHSGFTPEDQTNQLLNNITNVAREGSLNGPSPNDDKTIVVVHLQTYSAKGPPSNESDLVDAQKFYGFGANNFEFGGIDTIVSAFRMLRNANVDGNSGTNFGLSGKDAIARIRNFVNATQTIHTWSHALGEMTAQEMFAIRNNTPNQDGVNIRLSFIDAAPVTDTLSAVII